VKVPLFDGAREFEADRAELLAAAEEVLASGRYILGEPVRRFERQVEGYLGGGHAVGVASGTDALILALRACGVGPGDRVLTTPFSFFATAGAIVNVGAEPVFADIEPNTLNLDPEQVAEVLSRRSPLVRRLGIDPGRIKAMIVVHLFGLPVDLDRFLELGQYFGVRVIQDAAQAFGSRYRGRAIGAAPDVTTFSFFPTKNLGGFGDGGMVVTPSEEAAEHVRLLRAHGATGKYVHDVMGTNSRLDVLQSALLSVRLGRIDEALAARERIAAAYDRALAEVPGLGLPARPAFADRTFHQYVIRVGADRRDDLRASLGERGIETAVHYPRPLHLQGAFAPVGYRHGDLPEAEAASRRSLSLPIFPSMTAAECAHVTGSVVQVHDGVRASA
jgi:dTDP-4-amino-4,6-dideoxygalactose transaminase